METRTESYLRTGEVAQRLGVCPTTVRALVVRGVLPALRVGTQLRFTSVDVERLLLNARVDAGQRKGL